MACDSELVEVFRLGELAGGVEIMAVTAVTPPISRLTPTTPTNSATNSRSADDRRSPQVLPSHLAAVGEGEFGD